MSVRDPAPDSQHRSTITVDKSYFEEYDILHVKSKFPGCAQPLAARLGRAISGRRQYLSYRETHHEKLAKKIELVGIEEPRTEHTSNSTEATQTNSFEVLDGDDALSQMSYASPVNSKTAIRIPPLPKIAHEQEHFECPLCFMIVSIHTNAGWSQHVYRDLHPGCCTFDNCTTADRLYDSRHDWFNHELEAHRTSWQCIEGCQKTFSNKDNFELHVAARHPDLASPDMLAALRRTSKRSANLSARVNCPLCDVPPVLHALQRHVGKHQEQLALFALPPNLEDTDEDAQDEYRDSRDSIIYMNEDPWTDEEQELHPRFQYYATQYWSHSDAEGVEVTAISGDPSHEVETVSTQNNLEIGEGDGVVDHKIPSILRKPTEKFPEDPEPIREGVAPHKSAVKGEHLPPNARWTKIDRRLVDPQALEEAKERFEERIDCVIVLRVLMKEEIQKLAERTKEIRESREESYE